MLKRIILKDITKEFIMNKKIKSTYDEHIESLPVNQKKEFDQGLKDFALSELILALMERDDVSVRKLAKIAGISPTVVQAMRSGEKDDFSMQSFFKILKGLGCKKLMIEVNDQYIPLDISHIKR
jgi:DNA-binding Xre family transcriptional regulator